MFFILRVIGVLGGFIEMRFFFFLRVGYRYICFSFNGRMGCYGYLLVWGVLKFLYMRGFFIFMEEEEMGEGVCLFVMN